MERLRSSLVLTDLSSWLISSGRSGWGLILPISQPQCDHYSILLNIKKPSK
ncbi:hypothetical protein PO909_009555 [Leuciscus waleckii]